MKKIKKLFLTVMSLQNLVSNKKFTGKKITHKELKTNN